MRLIVGRMCANASGCTGELYDLEADPDEARDLLAKDTGRARTPAAERARKRLVEALIGECDRTAPPAPKP